MDVTNNIMNQSLGVMADQAVKRANDQANTPQNIEKIDDTAKEMEAVFLSQMLGHMFAGIEVDNVFGGGQAEKVYRDMLNQEYGKIIAESGGIGLADSLRAEMIKLQEGHM